MTGATVRSTRQRAAITALLDSLDEFRSAHALLVSGVQLAGSAARIRLDAALSGDIARAWDASSAAALVPSRHDFRFMQ